MPFTSVGNSANFAVAKDHRRDQPDCTLGLEELRHLHPHHQPHRSAGPLQSPRAASASPCSVDPEDRRHRRHHRRPGCINVPPDRRQSASPYLGDLFTRSRPASVPPPCNRCRRASVPSPTRCCTAYGIRPSGSACTRGAAGQHRRAARRWPPELRLTASSITLSKSAYERVLGQIRRTSNAWCCAPSLNRPVIRRLG